MPVPSDELLEADGKRAKTSIILLKVYGARPTRWVFLEVISR
jgi:hypothetical protein